MSMLSLVMVINLWSLKNSAGLLHSYKFSVLKWDSHVITYIVNTKYTLPSIIVCRYIISIIRVLFFLG